MAEEQYVSMGQFGEFVKRMDERFDRVNELADQRAEGINQRFDAIHQRLADAEKARAQNLLHINQRFDGLEKRMDQFHADMPQMRNWLVRLYSLVVLGFIGAIALILCRDMFFKSPQHEQPQPGRISVLRNPLLPRLVSAALRGGSVMKQVHRECVIPC